MVATVVVASLGMVPAQAEAAGPDTRFTVIATTQGPAKDDFDTFRQLYEKQRKQYGGGPIGIRLFSPGLLPLPGDNNMPGKLLAWAVARHPDEAITVSHKTRDDARLRALLDWANTKHVRVSIIYFHEVQDNWAKHHDARAKPEVYLETYRAYRKIIQAHPARPLITLEKNLMWFWQHYSVAKQGGDWRLFVEKKNDPADLVSWDTYVFPGMPTAQGRYATPDEFFRYARDVWRETGKPWAVGEIGTTVQDGTGPCAEKNWDPKAEKFTAWVKVITAAASNPSTIGPEYRGMPAALFMKWWAGPDANACDQSLDQAPAAVAFYRGLMPLP
ncbi:hypothetical protein BJ973_002047 [Actinoplanes tereljensis]|uniref:GH26 domain-containing protein n=1 Tax=Paractinoplanes tereljensis TaxID=571912 RepID=A0A919NKA7_9ACTN|nr:hypothetical protein [Actinoplanes tereljensis]GIF20048.1 hypothetical protein Ate02nite_27780 [Actinoplanes tereljensis]